MPINGNTTHITALRFYRPDALSDAQPTVSLSKHWRHCCSIVYCVSKNVPPLAYY